MAVIEISSSFGTVIAKPMELVDIHDVQPMADADSIEIPEANPLASAASDPAQDEDDKQ